MNTLLLTNEEMSTLLLGAVVGAIATFIIWVIPTELFKPKIIIKAYHQTPDNTTIKKTNGDLKEMQFFKRNIHIANTSLFFAAYKVTCFVQLFDAEESIVYREEKTLPIVKANNLGHPIVLPYKRLTVHELEELNATRIEMDLVYENRYGTKKTSGPWCIERYNLSDQKFMPSLKKRRN